MRCRRSSWILGELDTDIQIDDRDLNIYIYMCVCVSVMIICAYMYASTSYGYVTSSLSDDPLFVASGPDAALSWIDWNCCICISTSKKDMRCLQVVSALLEGPSLPWRGWVALLDANVGKSCSHELTTDTHTHIQVNTNGFTHGSAAAQLHLDVADTGSRLDDVERKKLPDCLVHSCVNVGVHDVTGTLLGACRAARGTMTWLCFWAPLRAAEGSAM